MILGSWGTYSPTREQIHLFLRRVCLEGQHRKAIIEWIFNLKQAWKQEKFLLQLILKHYMHVYESN